MINEAPPYPGAPDMTIINALSSKPVDIYIRALRAHKLAMQQLERAERETTKAANAACSAQMALLDDSLPAFEKKYGKRADKYNEDLTEHDITLDAWNNAILAAAEAWQ